MKDLTGQRFGRLVAIEPTDKRNRGLVVWRCRCDCGRECEVVGAQLSKGATRSCGCLRRERPTPDLAGQRFGRLTVVEKTGRRDRGSVVWRCSCDCGNTCEATTASLRAGSVRSCGCLRDEALRRDLAGQRFGRLTAKRPVGRKGGYILWECDCDCGNTKLATTGQLTGGKVRSCGCLRSQGRRIPEDLTGQRFGRLEVLGPTERRAGKTVVWKCRCDCGNEAEVPTNALKSGNTRSCGCLRGDAARRDLAGQRFGKLVAVRPTGESRNGSAVWECACDCGESCEQTARRLVTGHATSCGCEPPAKLPRNLAGHRFGRLTAIEPTDARDRGSVVWRCVCECGTFCDVPRRRLTGGTATSCGCTPSR